MNKRGNNIIKKLKEKGIWKNNYHIKKYLIMIVDNSSNTTITIENIAALSKVKLK